LPLYVILAVSDLQIRLIVKRSLLVLARIVLYPLPSRFIDLIADYIRVGYILLDLCCCKTGKESIESSMMRIVLFLEGHVCVVTRNW
jgi:hypothetical protein